MNNKNGITRRSLLLSTAAAGYGFAASQEAPPLAEFSYGEVQLAPGRAQTQFEQTRAVLLGLDDDSLLKPWRLRAGLPAPGPDLGGWYDEVPLTKTPSGGHGFAPGHSFGQWLSALSRGYAIDRDPATKAKLDRLLTLYRPAISSRFYQNFRFPAYNFDKLVIGLTDAQHFADCPDAFNLLALTADAATPHLPPTALDRDEPQRQWRQSVGESTRNDYTWDESYTLPENLYLAASRGAGDRYRTLARRFLLNRTWFDPLARGENVLPGHHAYSFCNSLSSAMQAYLSDGSTTHLEAARNGFDMIAAQSFATGAWGPNESFVKPDGEALAATLDSTHRSFETPCGSYAHFKLTRYLLRVTADGRYGDSMERVFYNTVLGASPLQSDGRAFYYADYHGPAEKTYFPDAWPCCSGTLPQVTADYRLLLYFHDAQGIYANLYLPSTLRWVEPGGAEVQLTQSGDYPVGNQIEMALRLSRPAQFALRLRIPAWRGTANPDVRVNGERIPGSVERGFFSIRRQWQTGDRVELRLPLQIRLEPISPNYPNRVAVLRGPLVLFPISNDPVHAGRQELLDLRRASGQTAWVARTAEGPKLLIPFPQIVGERYWTYSVVS